LSAAFERGVWEQAPHPALHQELQVGFKLGESGLKKVMETNTLVRPGAIVK
jgi:hypothetical protein